MSGKLKSLFSDSVIYGLSGVITRFITIFLVPFYTKVFSPADYGVISLINNYFILISIILVMAMDNASARWFYDTEDPADKKQTINTWLWFYLALSVAGTITIISCSSLLNQWLLGSTHNGNLYFMMVAITLPTTALSSVANNVMRFERKPIPTVSLALITSLVNIGMNIYLVIFQEMGIRGVFYAQITSSVTGAVISFVLIRKWISLPFSYNFTRLKAMLGYGWPFIPAGIAYWVVNLSGIFFISGYLDKWNAGLYQIGASVAGVLGMLTNAFQQAWGPFAFSIMNDPEAKKTYANVFNIYIVVFLSGCVFVALFGQEILILLTQPEYYEAADVATVLSYSYLFIGLTYIADLGPAIAKQTKPLGFIMTISAILIVILNVLLTPVFGRVGTALALGLSQMINPVYMFFKSQQVYFIPYQFKKAVLFTLAAIAFSCFSFLYLNDFSHYRVFVKIMVFLLFTGLILFGYNNLFAFLKNKRIS